MDLKTTIKAIVFLPATLLHELSHAAVAVATFSKIVSFSIIPKIIKNKNEYRLIYGSVNYIPSFKIFSFFISFAPIALWVISAWILLDFNIVNFTKEGVEVNVLDSTKNIFLTILAAYMFLGGIPSRQDVKVALLSLFSISGLLFIFLLFIAAVLLL